jgi:hypothetical protein
MVELAGYYIVSERLLAGEIVQHYQPTALEKGTDQINIYSNFPLNEIHKKNFADVYGKEGIQKYDIRFFTDALTFEQYIDLQDTYNYVLDVNFNAVPFALVEEGENTLGATAIWQSKYIWCLYKWVLIRKEKPSVPSIPNDPPLQTFGM